MAVVRAPVRQQSYLTEYDKLLAEQLRRMSGSIGPGDIAAESYGGKFPVGTMTAKILGSVLARASDKRAMNREEQSKESYSRAFEIANAMERGNNLSTTGMSVSPEGNLEILPTNVEGGGVSTFTRPETYGETLKNYKSSGIADEQFFEDREKILAEESLAAQFARDNPNKLTGRRVPGVEATTEAPLGIPYAPQNVALTVGEEIPEGKSAISKFLSGTLPQKVLPTNAEQALSQALRGAEVNELEFRDYMQNRRIQNRALELEEQKNKIGKITFTKPEQQNVTTILQDGTQSTDIATLRYKTTVDGLGNTNQILQIRDNETGKFREANPNERIGQTLKENDINEKNYIYQGIEPIKYKDSKTGEIKTIYRNQTIPFDKQNPTDVNLLNLLDGNPTLFRIGSMYSNSNLTNVKPLALSSNLTQKIGTIGTSKYRTIDGGIEQVVLLDEDIKDNNGEIIVFAGTYNNVDNLDKFNIIKSVAEGTSVSERTTDKKIILKNNKQMTDLSEKLQQKRSSLAGMYRLIKKINNSDIGFNRFFDEFKAGYNTLIQGGLTPEEIALKAAKGETQGLIGALRIDVLGPGVVTEQDALRLLSFVGGQAGAFDSVAVFREQIKGILDQQEQSFLEDYEVYTNLQNENEELYQYTPNIKDVTKTFETRAFFDDTVIPDLSSGSIKTAKPNSVIWNRLAKLIEENPDTYQNMITSLQLQALQEMLKQ